MHSSASTPQRLLIVMPSWVGDAVMATPTLRAVRALFPAARITYLLKSYVRPVVDALPWHDRLIVARSRGNKGGGEPGNGSLGHRRPRPNLAARVRRRGFDTAILLPNSFRAALLVSTAGIPRRVGYDRDGRGFLLTDRLLPVRRKGRFVPTSAVDYYLGLARYLGAESPDPRPRLFTRPEHDERAERLLRGAGVDPDAQPVVLLNPGAATKGDAKLWPADRFADLADRLVKGHGAAVLVNGSPKERAVLDAVHAAAKHRLVDLPRLGGDLTLLKSILRRCALAVTNDTGGRHVAAAIGCPVVSLFGPTDPRWTLLGVEHERIIHAPDGRMTSIAVEQVLGAAEQLLLEGRAVQAGSGS